VKQYLYAGADLAFITYVETMDEVEKITREVKGPVSIAAGQSYNMKNFSIKDLQKCGVARVSLPTLLMNSCLFSMEKSLKLVKDDELHKINLN
ncbi:MAG: isocitrate lyase/phosphoenolpyruvate mutase family protein, partial [Methanothermobacter sp.]